jgi:glycosyltransferase domain-containing protein
MPAEPNLRYTLLIPTYNRASQLRGLLAYLAARGFEYPIRVLDSSAEEALAINRKTISESPLNVTHQIYDNSINTYAKFALGVQSVETPYCSFCADDDILFTANLAKYLDVLDADPSLVAAHGYYVNFKPGDVYSILYTVYSAPSIVGSDGLHRILQQMSNYQAVFYAVYRKSVLEHVMRSIQGMQTLLSLELLASSLTLVAGGVQRIPEFYMGRNTNPSIATEGWHPHQFLATDPASLFREYAAYRDVVLAALMADPHCRDFYGRDRLQRVLDLAHLKYLQPLLSPAIIDYIIQNSMDPALAPQQVVEGVWRTFVVQPEDQRKDRPGKWAAFKLGVKRYLSRLGQSFRPMGFKAPVDVWINHTTRDGAPRRYELFREFLNQNLPGHGPVTAADIDTILDHLDAYV